MSKVINFMGDGDGSCHTKLVNTAQNYLLKVVGR